MHGTRVDIRTEDGVMDVYLFTPQGTGPWPAVVMYMDAFGIRPELCDMAQRLAGSNAAKALRETGSNAAEALRDAGRGYVVALPNLYYRSGPFVPFDREAVAVDGPERNRFKGMIQSIDSAMVMRDTSALLAVLDHTSAARADRIGVVGYCMGGGYAIAAAGTFAERVAAAASFHGGSLATDKADSPHTFAPHIRAKVYVGAAEIDPSFPIEQQERLERAFGEAGVDYLLEVYHGAKHGFAVTGHLVFDRDASERHWLKLTGLFEKALH
jgi:carboxymethylenebutenolidase